MQQRSTRGSSRGSSSQQYTPEQRRALVGLVEWGYRVQQRLERQRRGEAVDSLQADTASPETNDTRKV